MPLFTIKGRRRQITTASTTYAPNVAILVQPRSRNYIPIVPPARPVTRVIKPLVMLVPTGIPGGSPPSRSIRFVGIKPPVGRPLVPRVYQTEQTPFVNGTPYGKVSLIAVKRVVRQPARPFRALVPYGNTTPTPPTPAQIRPFIQDRRFVSLGTDGFGCSDTRESLRAYFEVDRHFIALAALGALADAGTIDRERVGDAIRRYGIDPEKTDPSTV